MHSTVHLHGQQQGTQIEMLKLEATIFYYALTIHQCFLGPITNLITFDHFLKVAIFFYLNLNNDTDDKQQSKLSIA